MAANILSSDIFLNNNTAQEKLLSATNTSNIINNNNNVIDLQTTLDTTSQLLADAGGGGGLDATNTKLLAALILFVTTLFCGYAPVKFILNQKYIQYAIYLGGGVLMATAFCHLIPETHDNYREAMERQTTTISLAAASVNATAPDAPAEPAAPVVGGQIPVPEIVLCLGFFFMYIVELLMMRFINNRTHEHPCDTGLSQLSEGFTQDQCSGPGGAGAAANESRLQIGSGENNICSSEATLNFSSSSIGGGSSSNSARTEFYKFLRGLLIVSAFAVHSIFDGVAIGSQESVSSVWTVFVAISCHKLIIAAVVGLELHTATLESRLWTLVHLFLFSSMSPIGILLIVLAKNSLQLSEDDPVMILLQCFATGTLIYIVFIEILQPKEGQTHEKNGFGKSFSLIAGFVLMLMALTLIGE